MRPLIQVIRLLCVTLLLAGAWGWPTLSHAGKSLTLKEVENRLVRGGYVETLLTPIGPWSRVRPSCRFWGGC